jgi:polyisoprenoid-binding protein YceI
VKFVLVISSLIISLPSILQAEKFNVNSPTKTDSVYFESSAKLEFIQGKTAAILGYVSFDPANTSTCEGYLRVDAASLKTGIELRDEHMRTKHLHTDKFPYIEFKLKSVSGLPANLASGRSSTCQVTGDFSIFQFTAQRIRSLCRQRSNGERIRREETQRL